jgi:exonuclease III
MPRIYKIGTLNVNGISSDTHLSILENFLRCNDIDLMMLHENTTHKFNDFEKYTPYVNIGAKVCGTAILTKEGPQSSNLKRLPSGRGMAIHMQDIS